MVGTFETERWWKSQLFSQKETVRFSDRTDTCRETGPMFIDTVLLSLTAVVISVHIIIIVVVELLCRSIKTAFLTGSKY